MPKYTVYFEMFGKKMKTDVDATGATHAMFKVKDKVVIHKVVEKSPSSNEILNIIKDIFGK